MDENGGEGSRTGGTRAFEVHLELVAREVGRPEDDLGSGFAGMDEEVLRPGATDEQRQYNRRRVTPHHRHEALS